MKTIILAASIFYILGLKFSNSIDISIKTSPVDTITTSNIIQHKPAVSVFPYSSPAPQIEADSLKTTEPIEKEESKT